MWIKFIDINNKNDYYIIYISSDVVLHFNEEDKCLEIFYDTETILQFKYNIYYVELYQPDEKDFLYNVIMEIKNKFNKENK